MNPFDYIKEMRDTLEEKKTAVTNTSARLSAEQHYQEMINMLNILEIEMQHAEYNYQVQTVEQKVKTFDDYTVTQQQLSDDVLIFQPVCTGEELSAIDMQSLADTLRTLHNNDIIKENMVLLPPNINIFRAVLANNPARDILEEEDFDI